MTTSTSPPIELTALLTALDKVEPEALTSCPGWTAHHLAAHICGNYEEIEQHVDAFEDGRPLERTRTWEERERPLRELDHATLLARTEGQAASAAAVIGRVLADQPEAELTWTGRTVRVAGFPTHLRSEAGPFVARVRCEGRDDLVVKASTSETSKCEAHLSVAAAQGPPTIYGDPAARLLLVWGRKPAPFYRLRAGDDRSAAYRAQALLAGY